MTRSLNDTLAAYFEKRPNVWIDGKQLAEIAGGYGWRSRCSDLRRFYGMAIDNRQRRMTRADGSKFVISEYRYVPEVEYAVEANGQQVMPL